MGGGPPHDLLSLEKEHEHGSIEAVVCINLLGGIFIGGGGWQVFRKVTEEGVKMNRNASSRGHEGKSPFRSLY